MKIARNCHSPDVKETAKLVPDLSSSDAEDGEETMTSDSILEPQPASPDTYVAETGTAKGRGVFAMRDFQPDEIVEVCPLTDFPSGSGALSKDLSERLFKLPDPFDPGKEWYLLTYDCATLYNHSNPANLRYSIDAEEKTVTFRARIAIHRNEELTINYGARDRGS